MEKIHTTQGEALAMFKANQLTAIQNGWGKTFELSEDPAYFREWRKKWGKRPNIACTVRLSGDTLEIVGRGHV